MKPLKIGFSACYFHSDPKRPIFKGKTLLYLEQSIAHWVLSQGVLAYMIPSLPPPAQNKKRIATADLVEDFDGLVLQGGSDVSPTHYGESPLKPEWAGDAVRDLHEMELLREFQSRGKPVLGICRGAQLINVALGGTLYQDIGTQAPGALDHRNWELYDQNFHEISFEPDSDLSTLYPGVRLAKVNTIHHQAIKDLGKGLFIEARCPQDKVIEAIKTADSLVYAVQWHPEFMDSADPFLLDSQPILNSFLERCRKRRSS